MTFKDRRFLFTEGFTGFHTDGFKLPGCFAATVEEALNFLLNGRQ